MSEQEITKDKKLKNDEKFEDTKQDGMKKYLPLVIASGVVVAVLAAGAFSMFIFTNNHKRTARNWAPIDTRNDFGGYRKWGGMMGGGRDGRMARRGGETVSAISSSSITVKYRDGATKTYAIDSNTRVLKTDRTYGSISDVKTDTKVIVRSLDPTATNPVASDIVLLPSSSTTL